MNARGAVSFFIPSASEERRRLAAIADSRPAARRTSCPATIGPTDAATRLWDVVVIGAGPAGALAACELAAFGCQTLLVDRCAFPRRKVCGGCINGVGTRLLRELGLNRVTCCPLAAELRQLELRAAGRIARLPLNGGICVSRDIFDAALVQEAVSRGAEFLPETTVEVRAIQGRWRRVRLQSASHGKTTIARGRLVIVADGLGRSSLKRHAAFAPEVVSGSRIGLGATLSMDGFSLSTGVISMSVGREGYVGLVRTPQGHIDLAAAVNSASLRQFGPRGAVERILQEADTPIPSGLETVEWRGTGPLTRSARRLGAARMLLIGDSAGYVEPFTGEGITWALLSAGSAAQLGAAWLRCDSQTDSCTVRSRRELADRLLHCWSACHGTFLAPRLRGCRILTSLLRRPAVVRSAIGLLSHCPNAADPIVRHFWNS